MTTKTSETNKTIPTLLYGNSNRTICQTRSRDLLICLASLAILATIALPSLLVNHPDESTAAKRRTRSAAGPRVEKVSYQDLLVKEPIHQVESANPNFWLANSRQWLENQVGFICSISSFSIFSL